MVFAKSKEFNKYVKFLTEKTKNVKKPMKISAVCREFMANYDQVESYKSVLYRFEKSRTEIQKLTGLDTDTRVKIAFALSAPLEPTFLTELRKNACVKLDRSGRIREYSKKSGGRLELHGEHGYPRASTTEKTQKLLRFLAFKSENADTPIPDKKLIKEYIKSTGDLSPKKHLIDWYSSIKAKIPYVKEFDKRTKAKMMFVSNTKVPDKFLLSIRSNATVKVDDQNRIIEYKAHNGSVQFGGDSDSKKRKKKIKTKRKRESDDEDEDEDIDEDLGITTVTRSGRTSKKRIFFSPIRTLLSPVPIRKRRSLIEDDSSDEEHEIQPIMRDEEPLESEDGEEIDVDMGSEDVTVEYLDDQGSDMFPRPDVVPRPDDFDHEIQIGSNSEEVIVEDFDHQVVHYEEVVSTQSAEVSEDVGEEVAPVGEEKASEEKRSGDVGREVTVVDKEKASKEMESGDFEAEDSSANELQDSDEGENAEGHSVSKQEKEPQVNIADTSEAVPSSQEKSAREGNASSESSQVAEESNSGEKDLVQAEDHSAEQKEEEQSVEESSEEKSAEEKETLNPEVQKSSSTSSESTQVTEEKYTSHLKILECLHGIIVNLEEKQLSALEFKIKETIETAKEGNAKVLINDFLIAMKTNFVMVADNSPRKPLHKGSISLKEYLVTLRKAKIEKREEELSIDDKEVSIENVRNGFEMILDICTPLH